MTASINDNVIMGDDSYDAFLKILEGDCNRSVTVDSPPAVELGEVLNPAGGFVSHGLSSLNSNSSHGVSNLLLESQDIESLDSNVSTIPASVRNEVGHACRRSALTRSAKNYYLSGDAIRPLLSVDEDGYEYTYYLRPIFAALCIMMLEVMYELSGSGATLVLYLQGEYTS